MHDEKTDYIKVENGRLTVILSSIGAGVWEVLWDGNLINLAPKREIYPEDTQFNGKTLARTAGRIPCDITINGKIIIDRTTTRILYPWWKNEFHVIQNFRLFYY